MHKLFLLGGVIMNYVVQVWCTGLGWADSKWGGDTKEDAEIAEKVLREDDSAWVNPELPRQTRVQPTVSPLEG